MLTFDDYEQREVYDRLPHRLKDENTEPLAALELELSKVQRQAVGANQMTSMLSALKRLENEEAAAHLRLCAAHLSHGYEFRPPLYFWFTGNYQRNAITEELLRELETARNKTKIARDAVIRARRQQLQAVCLFLAEHPHLVTNRWVYIDWGEVVTDASTPELVYWPRTEDPNL